MYYIYKISNKTNGMAYIGCTTKLGMRITQHFAADPKFNPIFHKAIREYGITNFTVEVLATTENEAEAYVLEQKYIKENGTTIPNGYNATLGGKGGLGNTFRKVVVLDKNCNYIKTFENTHEASVELGIDGLLICGCMRKDRASTHGYRFITEEEYQKYGTSKIQKRAIHKGTPVLQFSKNGDFIAEYNSLNEAADALGIDRHKITACLTGSTRSGAGYIWVRKSEYDGNGVEAYSVKRKGKKVSCLDLTTGEVVATYNSIADAAKAIGAKNHKFIQKVVDKPNLTAYKYKWVSA